MKFQWFGAYNFNSNVILHFYRKRKQSFIWIEKKIISMVIIPL